MAARLTPRLLVLLVTPPLLWAGNAIVGRLVVGSIGPLWLNVLRWLLAAVILLPLGWTALATPAARAHITRRWRYLAVIGLLGVGAYNALQYLALQTSTPLNATLIASSMPVWTLLLGAVAFGVHPSLRQLAGAALTLIGVAVVLARGNPAALLEIRLAEGDLLMLVAILGWALYSWLLAQPPAHMRGSERPPWDWAAFLLVQCIFGLCWTGMGAGLAELLIPSVTTDWSWSLLAIIVFVAVGPSVIAYRAWGIAVAEAGPALAAIFANLTPLFAGLMSALILGEGPQGFHGLAFLLIVTGILVSSTAGGGKR